MERTPCDLNSKDDNLDFEQNQLQIFLDFLIYVNIHLIDDN